MQRILSRKHIFFFLPLLLLSALVFFISNRLNFPAISAAEYSRRVVESCKHDEHQDVCLAEQFRIFSRKNTLPETLQLLTTMQEIQKIQRGCHFIAHVIASEEVLKSDGRWEDVLAELPITACTGGFIMGTIEGYKTLVPDFTLNADVAPKICKNLSARTDDTSELTCAHTMGHLFLIEHKGASNQAIRECSLLPSAYRYECHSGVFMENLYRRNLLAHGVGEPLPWDEKSFVNQQALCRQYSASIAQACWRELSHMIIVLADRNQEKIHELCELAENQNYQTACLSHAGEVLKLLTAPMHSE